MAATGIFMGLGLFAAPAGAAPTLGLSATGTVIGGAIQASAQLSALEGAGATGTITFEVFGPDDSLCAGPALTPEPTAATVVGAGEYPSGTFTPTAPGTYHWSAHYSGDGENAAADATCAALSVVAKASPSISGLATSGTVGGAIHDEATLSGGFQPGGQLGFRAYGPADSTCSSTPAYEAEVAVNGNGSYSPAGFSPPPGLYLWTVAYSGDADNEATSTACGATNQGSAVGTLNVNLGATAAAGTVGGAVTATATIANGAIPGGQLTFKAFAPGNATCAGAAAFTSTVPVSGNGSYRSAALSPTRVGSYRWTVAYSGDANHAAAGVACGAASSPVAKASPTIVGEVGGRLKVGTSIRDTATLLGAYAPTGTVTFSIYGPGGASCAKPAFVNTVAVNGSGTVSSDPFVAKRAGRYRFVASYSGDAANQAATEACGSLDQLAKVQKRTPKLRPAAKLIGSRQISIRARLSRAASPTGTIAFRLFRPGDLRCADRPAFSGGLKIKANGSFSLAQYIATKPGVYRLAVTYSGDPRNTSSRTVGCKGTQPISVVP